MLTPDWLRLLRRNTSTISWIHDHLVLCYHVAVRKNIKNPMCVGETNKLVYFDIFLKLWRAVYPSNKAPIGAKLCENAFQTIPVNSIFGEQKPNVDELLGPRTSFLVLFGQFLRIWRLRTSKSTSSHFFALDATILGSVRPNIDEQMSVSKFWRQKSLACGVVYPRHVNFLFLRRAGHYS